MYTYIFINEQFTVLILKLPLFVVSEIIPNENSRKLATMIFKKKVFGYAIKKKEKFTTS